MLSPLLLYKWVNWGVERERNESPPPPFPRQESFSHRSAPSPAPSVPSSLLCQTRSVLIPCSFASLHYSGKLR